MNDDNIIFIDFSQSESFLYKLEKALSRIHKAIDDLLILIYEHDDSKVL
jgi:hypothetical protein